jgi:hypothetical protein
MDASSALGLPFCPEYRHTGTTIRTTDQDYWRNQCTSGTLPVYGFLARFLWISYLWRRISGTRCSLDGSSLQVSDIGAFALQKFRNSVINSHLHFLLFYSSFLSYAQVGRWNRNNRDDDYEEFEIVTEYVHPQFNKLEITHDFLLLKIDGLSNKQHILLNDDPKLPTGNVNDELTVIGFGMTVEDDLSTQANILKQVGLHYVTNDVCALAEDPTTGGSYQGLITSDMLCATDDGQDSCQGDSGGPLLIQNGAANRDVLVGLVSWGLGCALPGFPGIYSRISDQIDWIQSTICLISSMPPTEFGCEGADPPSQTPPSDTVPVTIYIQFDDFPRETGWSIEELVDGHVLLEVPTGSYGASRSRVEETVFLVTGKTYVFVIDDKYGDGLNANVPGNYLVVFGRSQDGEVLVSGGGNFGFRQRHEFTVPYPEPDELIIEEGQIPLTVLIQLGTDPSEVGWQVDRLGLEVEAVIRVPAGIYTTPLQTVVRTLILEEGELYSFLIFDFKNVINNGFGECIIVFLSQISASRLLPLLTLIRECSVKLFLGTTDIEDESRMILNEDGDFGSGAEYTFIASYDTEPAAAPLLSDFFFTLELRMDLYPEEVGLQLRVNKDEIAVERSQEREDSLLFFRPTRYYADYGNQAVMERIPMLQSSPGSPRQYNFIITDSYGDGMCCNSVGQLDTGYTLYIGDPADGKIIVDSRFKETAREVTAFEIAGMDINSPTPSPVAPPVAPKPTAQIIVRIMLDIFPDETGFLIEDVAGKKVADFPAGSYSEQGRLVEEIITLEVGVYTFTIVDVGDGLKVGDSYYEIALNGDVDRPPLVTGNGGFAAEESHVFIVEGSAAEYPLIIQFETDAKPEEFGFTVKRLDLIESDALVASVPPGTYQKSNQEETVSLMITEGGLYKIVFEDLGQNGIGGLIHVLAGSSDPEDPEAQVFKADAKNFQEFFVNIFAGKSPPMIRPAARTLDLRVQFDRFPHEFEWVILGNGDNTGSSGDFSRSLRDLEVLAFGPSEIYPQILANTELVESIPLPSFSGEQSFTIIITDAAGDGICCQFGNGGPVELFDGSVADNKLLFSDPFEETGRLVETFVLVGDDTAPSSGESADSSLRRLEWFGFSLVLCALFTLFL